MRRCGRIAWYVLVAVSALVVLALMTVFSTETIPRTIGSTEIYCLLYGERIMVDIHDRHGWWNLLDVPVWATCVPVVVIAFWVELMRRKVVRTSGKWIALVRPLSFLVMVWGDWLLLVIGVGGVREVPAALSSLLAVFIPPALIACVAWGAIRLIAYAILAPQRKREWRIAQGLCVRCGYSLEGNTSGVCPECGSATLR